jgi:predicted nucleotide-binding protein
MNWAERDLETVMIEDYDDVVDRARSIAPEDRTAALRDALAKLSMTDDLSFQTKLLLFVQTLLAVTADKTLQPRLAAAGASELSRYVSSDAPNDLKRSALRVLSLLVVKAEELTRPAEARIRAVLALARRSSDPEINGFARRAFSAMDAEKTPSEERAKILLLHGTEQPNVSRLTDFVHEHWNADVVELRDLPSRGRTIVEALEAEISDATFVVALLTPDDFVDRDKERYQSARPNVMFELGLAYGLLGKSRICVFLQDGTPLPDELSGINRIVFEDDVLEAAPQLQTELDAVDILEIA